jgi:hypothetical protein
LSVRRVAIACPTSVRSPVLPVHPSYQSTCPKYSSPCSKALNG